MKKFFELGGDFYLKQGDCLSIMGEIPDKSINMILCDLPYGTTRNKWDTVIDLDELWKHYNRIIKDNGCIALFAQTPFDKVLGCSNIKMLKYEWIWEKPMATGFLNSKFCPLKAHENILIFSKSAACHVKDKSKAMVYNPQMTEGKPYTAKQGGKSTNYDFSNMKAQTVSYGAERFPRDIQRFAHDKDKLHPTQKPVKLLQYLIETYTNKGDIVLDNCMGSGSTGVASLNVGRRFVGIELDENYFNISSDRINEQYKIMHNAQ